MKADIRFLKPQKTPQSFPSVNPVNAVVSAALEVRGVYSVSVSSPGRGSLFTGFLAPLPFQIARTTTPRQKGEEEEGKKKPRQQCCTRQRQTKRHLGRRIKFPLTRFIFFFYLSPPPTSPLTLRYASDLPPTCGGAALLNRPFCFAGHSASSVIFPRREQIASAGSKTAPPPPLSAVALGNRPLIVSCSSTPALGGGGWIGGRELISSTPPSSEVRERSDPPQCRLDRDPHPLAKTTLVLVRPHTHTQAFAHMHTPVLAL